MQKQYVDGTLSAIIPLASDKKLSELVDELGKSDVRSITLFEGLIEEEPLGPRWKPIIKVKRIKSKRRRKRKAARLARRRNR